MPRIVLKELDTERTYTIVDSDALIGRDPVSAVVVEGPKSKVVSGRHARVFVENGSLLIEDVSRNGTVVDHERLQRGVPHVLHQGQVIGLGDTGPRFSVEAIDLKHVARTMIEPAPSIAPPPGVMPAAPAPTAPQPAMSAAPVASAPVSAARPPVRPEAERARLAAAAEPSTEPMGAAPDWIVHVVLRDTHTSQRFDVRSDVVKIGRAPACLVQIPPEQGASVSRIHAEILIEDGGVTLKDAGSRNGTYHNGKRIDGPLQVTKGDVIMLGAGGPSLAVEDLHIVKGDEKALRHTPPGSGAAISPDAQRSTPDAVVDPGPGKRASEMVRQSASAPRTASRGRALLWFGIGAALVIGVAAGLLLR